jgi:curved DNA-binding protein CbpA
MDEKQFKRLYRRLARRYHPDLARDQDEREIRNVQMAALNEAYEARSLIELAALAGNAKDPTGAGEVAGTDQQMIKILKKELATVRRRTLLIQNELENLHNLPTVQLSLQVKIARRSGRDLLAEMARDLKRQIARKTAERDLLKDQFEELSR